MTKQWLWCQRLIASSMLIGTQSNISPFLYLGNYIGFGHYSAKQVNRHLTYYLLNSHNSLVPYLKFNFQLVSWFCLVVCPFQTLSQLWPWHLHAGPQDTHNYQRLRLFYLRQYLQIGSLYIIETNFLNLWRLWSSKSRCWEIWCPMRDPFVLPKWMSFGYVPSHLAGDLRNVKSLL